jgi:hypothetical protein
MHRLPCTKYALLTSRPSLNLQFLVFPLTSNMNLAKNALVCCLLLGGYYVAGAAPTFSPSAQAQDDCGGALEGVNCAPRTFIDGVETVSEAKSNCCTGGILINDNFGVTCPGGIIGSVVDCKFVPDAVQPISSGSSDPYHGEFGMACLSSALGRPCKESGKDVCAPDVTAGCNENGNGCVDVFKAPTACKSPYSGGTSKTAFASHVVAVSAALAMLAAGIGQAF